MGQITKNLVFQSWNYDNDNDNIWNTHVVLEK